MSWAKSKTLWGTLLGSAVALGYGYGWIPDKWIPLISSMSILVFGVGLRNAISKNGKGK